MVAIRTLRIGAPRDLLIGALESFAEKKRYKISVQEDRIILEKDPRELIFEPNPLRYQDIVLKPSLESSRGQVILAIFELRNIFRSFLLDLPMIFSASFLATLLALVYLLGSTELAAIFSLLIAIFVSVSFLILSMILALILHPIYADKLYLELSNHMRMILERKKRASAISSRNP